MGTIGLDHLPAFVAVAETLSFSAAAAKLDIPKSSVSRSVSKLERALGVRLLHRTTRHVALSTAGAALYERVSPQLSSLLRSMGDLPELEEQPSGLLRVTATVDVGCVLLSDVMARFIARYPAVEVDLRLSTAIVPLVAQGFDIALRIARRPLRDSSLMAKKAGVVAFQTFASPAYLALRGTPRSPRDLEGHAWVICRGVGRVANEARLEGPTGTVVIALRGRITCDDMGCVRDTVCAGAGLALLPTFLAEEDVGMGRLVRVLPRWTFRAGDLYLVYPSTHPLPRKVTAFRDLVLEALQASPLALPRNE